MESLAFAIHGLGLLFLLFGVVAIVAIAYWSISGVVREKRQQQREK